MPELFFSSWVHSFCCGQRQTIFSLISILCMCLPCCHALFVTHGSLHYPPCNPLKFSFKQLRNWVACFPLRGNMPLCSCWERSVLTQLCWKQCSYILDALNTYRNYTHTKQPQLQVLTLPNFLIMMWHNKKILLILVLSHFLRPNQSSLGTRSQVGTGLHTSSVTVQLFLSSLTQNVE